MGGGTLQFWVGQDSHTVITILFGNIIYIEEYYSSIYRTVCHVRWRCYRLLCFPCRSCSTELFSCAQFFTPRSYGSYPHKCRVQDKVLFCACVFSSLVVRFSQVLGPTIFSSLQKTGEWGRNVIISPPWYNFSSIFFYFKVLKTSRTRKICWLSVQKMLVCRSWEHWAKTIYWWVGITNFGMSSFQWHSNWLSTQKRGFFSRVQQVEIVFVRDL